LAFLCVLRTAHCAQCALRTVHCVLRTACCALRTVHCVLSAILYPLSSILCPLSSSPGLQSRQPPPLLRRPTAKTQLEPRDGDVNARGRQKRIGDPRGGWVGQSTKKD
jgi:hypothetical protein